MSDFDSLNVFQLFGQGIAHAISKSLIVRYSEAPCLMQYSSAPMIDMFYSLLCLHRVASAEVPGRFGQENLEKTRFLLIKLHETSEIIVCWKITIRNLATETLRKSGKNGFNHPISTSTRSTL